MDDISPEQKKILQIFFPFMTRKQAEAAATSQRFVHYSPADAAIAMISNEEVWMRNSSCMNDFMEAEHGFDCLNYAYKSDAGKILRQLLDDVGPEFSREINDSFNNRLPSFREKTWITCFSEHSNRGDRFVPRKRARSVSDQRPRLPNLRCSCRQRRFNRRRGARLPHEARPCKSPAPVFGFEA